MSSQKGIVWLPALLAILGVLVVGGGAYVVVHTTNTPVTPSTSNNAVSWKTYTNNEYGFSVNYPSDWKVSDQSFTYQGKQSTSIELSSPVRNLPQYKQYALDNVRFSIQISVKDGRKVLGWKQIYKKPQPGDQAVNRIISNDADLQAADAADYALAQQIFDSAKVLSTNSGSRPVSFVVTPASGPAPLAVETSPLDDCQFNTVDWGDGSKAWNSYGAQRTCGVQNPLYDKASHTYTVPGTYVATLKSSAGSTLGTVAITVTSQGWKTYKNVQHGYEVQYPPTVSAIINARSGTEYSADYALPLIEDWYASNILKLRDSSGSWSITIRTSDDSYGDGPGGTSANAQRRDDSFRIGNQEIKTSGFFDPADGKPGMIEGYYSLSVGGRINVFITLFSDETIFVVPDVIRAILQTLRPVPSFVPHNPDPAALNRG